ncbi:MAG: hypothetical protein QOE90_3266 [Thermoplasmata archaeon]|jgi:hypothetical protein|nr:hypothetical protein [Thermoplasmata archaeon]
MHRRLALTLVVVGTLLTALGLVALATIFRVPGGNNYGMASLLVLGLAILLPGIASLRGPPHVAPSPARPTLPVPQVDVARLPEPIAACPRCGSPEMGGPGRDPLAHGGQGRCAHCAYRGPAILFDARADYAAWLSDA